MINRMDGVELAPPVANDGLAVRVDAVPAAPPVSPGQLQAEKGAQARRRTLSSLFEKEDEDDEKWEFTQVITSHTAQQLNMRQLLMDDGDEEGEDKVMEVVQGVSSWFFNHKFTIGLMLTSLIVTMLIWFEFDPENRVRWGGTVGIWIWTALPGLIILVYLICYFIEKAILLTANLIWKEPNWLLVVALDECATYLRLVLFTFSLDAFLIDWYNHYGNTNYGPIDALMRHMLRSIYYVALLVVLRNISLALVEFQLTRRTFRKPVVDTTFQRDILQLLWCNSNEDRKTLLHIWKADTNRKQFMLKVAAIRDNPLTLFLERDSDADALWSFSPNNVVEIHTNKEMSALASMTFDSICGSEVAADGSAPRLTLAQWRPYFQDKNTSKQAFIEIFSSNINVMKTKSATKDEFIGCWLKKFKAKTSLSNQLSSAHNAFKLIGNLAGGVFWVVMVFVVSVVFEFEITQVVTAGSAFIISMAFATSKSVSRAIESVLFIFASKPFAVNDHIKINGRWYFVESIGILETKVRDSSNLVSRLSNQELFDTQIANTAHSHQAICVMETKIGMDTTVEKIELLRSAVTKYSVMNAQSWKAGRVSFYQNTVDLSDGVHLEVRVESTILWAERNAYRLAEFELKAFFRAQLTRLGIEWTNCLQPVCMMPDPGAIKFTNQSPSKTPVRKQSTQM